MNLLIINDRVLTYAVMMFFRSVHVPYRVLFIFRFLIYSNDTLIFGRLCNRVCLMTGYLFNIIRNYMSCNNCETFQLSHANTFQRRLRHSSWDQVFSLYSRQLHSNCFTCMLRHIYHSISSRINHSCFIHNYAMIQCWIIS